MKKSQKKELETRIVEDPLTEEIAALLEIPVEEYVQEVIRFAAEPDLEPEVLVLSEPALRKEQAIGPTPDELLAWLRALAQGDGIGTDDEQARARGAAGAVALKSAPSVSDRRGQILASADLKSQIQSMRGRPRMPGTQLPGGRR